MSVPELTSKQWIAVGVIAVALVIISMIVTEWWKGQAVEITVENASPVSIFAYIDNTGRHGKYSTVEKLPTIQGGETVEGRLIVPAQSLSFGTAVGFFDSPTLHVLPVDGAVRADAAKGNDCAFDTVLFKLEVPYRHIRIKWNGTGCVVTRE